MLRVLINGNESTNRPMGVETLSESWKYSDDLKIFAVEITGSVVFFGEDFEYFYNLAKNNGCGIVDVEVHQRNGDSSAWDLIYNGFIFVNDIDFNLDERTATCEIVDNSFVARVVNNAETKIFCNWVTTKNGQPITPLIFNGSVQVKDSLNNDFNNRKGVKIENLFQFHLDWLSDNSILFESDFITTNTAATDAWLMSGKTMRNGTLTFPEMSFRELMTDLHKLFHLYGYFYDNNGQIVFKVEPFEYFENNAGLIELGQLKNITLTGNQKAYYSKVDFGSLKNSNINTSDEGVPVDTDDNWFYSFLNEYMLGYSRKDSVAITTTCNNADTLDLRMSRLITDINCISQCLNNPDNTDFDDDVFITNDSSKWEQIPNYPWIPPPTTLPMNGYWNKEFTNGKILSRWLSEICFAEPDYPYQCEMLSKTNSPMIISGAVLFDEVIDPCGYQHPTFLNEGCLLFPADFQGGIFNITTKLILKNVSGSPVNLQLQYNGWPSQDFYDEYPGYYIQAILSWIDSGWGASPPPVGNYSGAVTRTIAPGETVEYNGQWLNMPFYGLGFFILYNTGLAGLEIQPGSFQLVKPVLNDIFDDVINDELCGKYPYEFSAEGTITNEEISQIRSSQFSKIFLPNSFKNITGKHIELERNITTGQATIKILSKNC